MKTRKTFLPTTMSLISNKNNFYSKIVSEEQLQFEWNDKNAEVFRDSSSKISLNSTWIDFISNFIWFLVEYLRLGIAIVDIDYIWFVLIVGLMLVECVKFEDKPKIRLGWDRYVSSQMIWYLNVNCKYNIVNSSGLNAILFDCVGIDGWILFKNHLQLVINSLNLSSNWLVKS